MVSVAEETPAKQKGRRQKAAKGDIYSEGEEVPEEEVAMATEDQLKKKRKR